ncbi:alpha/beta fold hydrolase [Enterobacter cloacae]|uniref:alpha/beta fold hydrolase n=1 Tax=Enterobacter cloacae TaxID=550 RepID=UPI000680031C|nr:alpha/beta fold hydrolase [Enterobacter cloacae]
MTTPIAPQHHFMLINGIRTHYVTAGEQHAQTVVLLAGFPESWYAWRHVIPLLAERYHVIAPDLPGQGDTDCPSEGYDTHTLASHVHELLTQLGVHRYYLTGHDVGAWVAWPYAAMYSDEVIKLALLDAGIPGITLPDALPVTADRAWRTWHFAFHVVADLPEFLISGKERGYLEWFLRRKAANPLTFSEADLDEYLRIFTREGGLRAGLAYYRAAALSAAQNRALSEQGKLSVPVLALSADQGSIPDMASPLRAFAAHVDGRVIPRCGHFQPEEQPQAVADALSGFFSGD